MSLRLIGILPHRLASREALATLPDLLAPLDDLAVEIARQYSGRRDPKVQQGWRWESLGRRAPVGTTEHGDWIAPGDTFIKPGPRCIVVHTIAKWLYARKHPQIVEAAHRLVIGAARVLGSSEIIIGHDWGMLVEQWVREGRDIDGVVERLLQNDAFPVSSLAGLFVHEEPERWTPKDLNLFFHELLDGEAGVA